MRRNILALALAAMPITASARTMNEDIATRFQQIDDRIALKHLVDRFSVLADSKDVAGQLQLFTPDAQVDSYVDGKLSSSLRGRG